MRFSIILIALALLPVMLLAHTWYYARKQMPLLHEQVLSILDRHHIQDVKVGLNHLDLSVSGKAAGTPDMDAALDELRALRPLRLMVQDITVPSALRADLAGDRLVVNGSLPLDADLDSLRARLSDWRPDLHVETGGVRRHPQVRWPEREAGHWDADGPLLAPLMPLLAVKARLEVVLHSGGLRATGILPDRESHNAIRAALLASGGGAPVDAAGLRASPLAQADGFAEGAPLAAFLRDFFDGPAPRRFYLETGSGPVIEADALPSDESAWLALLRPATGGRRVDMRLRFHPSPWHFPGRKTESGLPAETLASLRAVLEAETLRFDGPGGALDPAARTRLAGLVPELLAAGPGLLLVIGGHPEGAGMVAEETARQRARRVADLLIESGLPGTGVTTALFERMPSSHPAASHAGTVEILVR